MLSMCLACGQNQPMEQNNLGKETSPYLLQHKSNPVYWQRWNQDLYRRFNSENKLIIVSIGYSSCHWCHVMEEETFEDPEVAQIMNTSFINIKVDREENPDVDNIYMTSVQLMTGRGGWPLNVITLPDGRPVYGGTYHTKDQWMSVLNQVQKIYQEDRPRLEDFAKKIEEGLKVYNTIEIPEVLSGVRSDSLHLGLNNWRKDWDLQYGGDEVSQKFIIPSRYQFLMQYQTLTKDTEIDNYIQNSLETIANSGVFDPIEGGFYRYSVDPYWEVPHFEKMLYDNAQVLGLYANAYKKYGNNLFRDRAYQVFEFMETRLLDTSDAYYAAIDADNELGEGRYYVYTKEELKKLIDKDWELFLKFYSVDFNKPFDNQFYILRQSQSLENFSTQNNTPYQELKSKIQYWKLQLEKELSQRDFPGIDTKLLASWNAQAIVGLIEAFKAFVDDQFLEKAISIFDFIQNEMIVDNELYHTYQQGEVKIEGFLEDYAYLIEASLSIYEVSGDIKYLNMAEVLTQKVIDEFSLEDLPYFSFKKDQYLITQIVSTEDNVLPSPNSIMAKNLFVLGQLIQNQDYIQRAEQMLLGVQNLMVKAMSGYSEWASLYAFMSYPYYEIIIVGSQSKQLSKEILKHYLPQIIFQQSNISSELPLLKDRFDSDKTYIYVCQNRVCLLPVTTIEEAFDQLENFSSNTTGFPEFSE